MEVHVDNCTLACRADDGGGPLDALRDFTADAHGPDMGMFLNESYRVP